MADYIERKKVYADVSRLLPDDVFSDYADGISRAIIDAMNIIEKAPAVDVRSERHGQWSNEMVFAKETAPGYHSDDVRFGFRCSECGAILNKTRYCGNCGAKMDGNGKSDNWIATSKQFPPENQIVDTKIEDEKRV